MPTPRRSDQKTAVDAVVMSDFRGLLTNSDPHGLPPGAAIVQVNAVAIRPGELRCRPGYAEVLFED